MHPFICLLLGSLLVIICYVIGYMIIAEDKFDDFLSVFATIVGVLIISTFIYLSTNKTNRIVQEIISDYNHGRIEQVITTTQIGNEINIDTLYYYKH